MGGITSSLSSVGGKIGGVAGGLYGNQFGIPGTVAGGLIGSKAGDAIGNAVGGGPDDKPQVPALDPRIKQMADAQSDEAAKYQADAGNMKLQQGNMARQQASQTLADTQAGVTQNANKRGLLYGGVHQGAAANAAGESARKLASTQAGINEGVDAQSAKLNDQALKSQMGVQDLQMKRNAMAYNLAQQ